MPGPRYQLLGIMVLWATINHGIADDDLIGHWPLAGKLEDVSGNGGTIINHGVELQIPGVGDVASGAARFDGRRAWLEIPASPKLRLGKSDLTAAVWVHTDDSLDDVIGDVLSQYDPVTRRGFQWTIKNSAGATTSQANYRQVQFGMNDGHEPVWRNAGRPGSAVYVMALAVHDGALFAGTCESAPEAAGHVYRYAGERQWIDCGSPAPCNAVTSLATYRGQLYAGVGRYRLAGSALPESTNPALGGKVFRYDGDGQWTDCGQLGPSEAVGGLAVYRGQLYGTSLYRPAGFFRYEGESTWTPCALPPGGERVDALGVFNGYLYATSYDGCLVFRYDGKIWENLVKLEDSGQTYSFEVHRGELFVGTWPNGRVFRFADERRWVDAGRLGTELEVMGMAVFQGNLYAGTLPRAEVYRYESDGDWRLTGCVDETPEVRYRRAWTMSVYGGELFCGTLPSGDVSALRAGPCVTVDRELPAGWRHLAAVRRGTRLQLYVDGQLAADAASEDAPQISLPDNLPLRVGAGGHDFFNGSLRDLRLYSRALSGEGIARLSRLPD